MVNVNNTDPAAIAAAEAAFAAGYERERALRDAYAATPGVGLAVSPVPPRAGGISPVPVGLGYEVPPAAPPVFHSARGPVKGPAPLVPQQYADPSPASYGEFVSGVTAGLARRAAERDSVVYLDAGEPPAAAPRRRRGLWARLMGGAR